LIKNKILIRTILLVVIVLIIILIVFRARSPFGKSNSSFAIDPDKEITRIEFSQNGKKLILENKGDNWFVNGKTEARKSGINFILRILKEIKIKSPVSEELFEREITSKNISPVKVRVFEKGRNLKTLYVYKTSSNIYGNIMKIKEKSKPFIVHVPGYGGEIGSGFTLNELFWQPFTVYNLLPSEIASIRFVNLSATSASFSISNTNHQFTLSGNNGNLTGWDPSLIVRYISYFAWVPFESWAFDMEKTEQEAIKKETPLYVITVITSAGKKKELTLWELSDEVTGKDSDRLLGKTNELDDLFIMRYFDVDPLIKKRSYFFPE
jgi:hypothetical protein